MQSKGLIILTGQKSGIINFVGLVISLCSWLFKNMFIKSNEKR
jgi:hypothetical protein